MVELLVNGMAGLEDFKLRLRHTWTYWLASFRVLRPEVGALRMSILKVLAILTCNVQGMPSLVLKPDPLALARDASFAFELKASFLSSLQSVAKHSVCTLQSYVV